jgi:hypothetical protein
MASDRRHHQVTSPMEHEMARTRRLSITGALIVCLIGSQSTGILFASDFNGSSDGPRALRAPTVSTELPASAAAPAPAIAVDDNPIAPDVSSAPPSVMEPLRLAFTTEALTANPPWGSRVTGLTGRSDVGLLQSSAFAGQIYQGRPRPIRRDNSGSIAAMVIGAVASITGVALLVYANRPECSTREFATGCGYGTKVVGGAVLSGGIVGLTIGALTWR